MRSIQLRQTHVFSDVDINTEAVTDSGVFSGVLVKLFACRLFWKWIRSYSCSSRDTRGQRQEHSTIYSDA